MADQTRSNANGHKNTSESPRLHIAHHQASRIEHTSIGEYHIIRAKEPHNQWLDTNRNSS